MGNQSVYTRAGRTMAERSELVRIIITNYLLDSHANASDHESASNLLTEQARRVIEYAMEEAKDL
jgi:hypothetical protein